MDSASRPSWLRYGIAALAVGMALLLKLVLNSLITEQSPFLLLAGAVMVGAWFGGLGPGLLATVLAALVADYFFLPPVGSLTGLGVAFLPLALFAVQGLVITSLTAALHSARQQAQASALEAQSHQESLRRGEERFRALVQNSSDVITVIEAEGTIRYVSPAVERVMGYRPEELVGRSVFDYVRPDVLADAQEIFAKAWSQPGIHSPFEFELPHKDGSWRLAEFFINNLLDDPAVRGVVINQRDITERKEVEQTLRESEELYRSVVEQAAESIFLVDADTKRVIQANATLHHSLGYTPEEFRELTLYDIVAHDREDIDRNIRQILEEGRRFVGESQYRCKDGSLIDVEVGASAISYGGREILCIVAHDVTERKKAEKERAWLAAIVESSDDAILSKTLEGTITSWNAGARKLYGYSAEETKGRSISMLMPEDRPNEISRILESVRRGERIDHFETVRVTKDGRLVYISLTVSPIEDSAGNMVGASAIARDITERKRTEETLRLSLDALLALYETGQVLSSSLKREEIGTSLLRIIEGVSGTTAAVINLSGDRRHLRAWRTIGPESLLASVRDEPEVRAARQAAFEAEEERLLKMKRPKPQGRRLAGLFVPLRMRDRVIGVLEVYGQYHMAESTAAETFFPSLASQAASALENAQLYEELAEHRRRLQDLVSKLVTAQEEERRRVAYEVHDGLAQVAAAAYQHLQNFAADNPPSSTHGEEVLDQALEMVQQTVGEARNVVADLRPTVLDDFGLATALRLQVERLCDEGLRASYEQTLGRGRLPEVVETTLFRVAQEAITNVRKHARADRVHVALERRGRAVRLQVRDWGRGFIVDGMKEADPRKCVGLSSMRERIALLGGHFEISSKVGAGTLVEAEIPLQEESAMGGGNNDG